MIAAANEDEILKHTGLVVAVVDRLWKRGEVKRVGTRHDIMQIGYVALLQAANQYGIHSDAFRQRAPSSIARSIIWASRPRRRRVEAVILRGDVMDHRGEERKLPDKKLLQYALSRLPEKQAKVIRFYYGFTDTGKRRTFEKIGKLMGFARSRAKFLHDAGVANIRSWLETQGELDAAVEWFNKGER